MTGNKRTTDKIIGCCKECCGPVKLIRTHHEQMNDYAICLHCLREVSLDKLEELEAYEQ